MVNLSKAIRVKYENGVLKPLDPVDLEEGEEVVVVRDKSFYTLAKTTNFKAKKSINEILDETRKRDRKLYD